MSAVVRDAAETAAETAGDVVDTIGQAARRTEVRYANEPSALSVPMPSC